MQDRRLPLTVTDDHGALHNGEIVIVAAWRPDIEPSPDAAFTIVLAGEPVDGQGARSIAATVAVCGPASAVRLPSAIGEAAVAYAAGNGAQATYRLPPRSIEVYARGRIVASRPIAITPAELFRGRTARFDALALALVSRRPDDHERYWRAGDEVLSWPDGPASPSRPTAVRSRLRWLLQQPGVQPALATQSGGRLQELVAGAEPASIAASPGALTEDIAFVRCVELGREGTDELLRMREYLDAARPGASNELATDHALIREQLSFVVLLEQSQQPAVFRASFDAFRREYTRAYTKHHDAYWRAAARLHRELEDARPARKALARLNTLRALGAPAGEGALVSYDRLTNGSASCSATDLAARLAEQPSCGACSLTMDDELNTGEAERTVRELNTALASQQRRLASEAVRRILGRGGERIDQFLRIAQASDTAALARVLDDDLLGFLRDLLDEPVSPTPEGLDLFEQLARAHPVVNEEQLDAVMDTLRQLLTEALAAQERADAAGPPAFRLAAPPS